jgi:oxaloacetate decarboxylase gamma subunit
MLRQSGVLTLFGMGIVFSFLAILIIVVSLAGKLIRIVGTDKDSGQPAQTAGKPSAAGAGDAGLVTAAISAAVNEYKKTH